MKVGIIGVGTVGSATALALMQRGSAREIVLVDRTRQRARAVATDMRYGSPVSPTVDIRDGSYEDLKAADLVMITVGVNEKTGGATDRHDAEGRLRLLDVNTRIYQDVVPQIVAAAPEAVLMVVTDPPDPLADLTRRLTQHDRVFSTGTVIDSLRFRVHLGERLGVNPAFVEAVAIGEHGTSEVLLWSSATVAGLSVQEACRQCGEPFAKVREGVERDVRYANITIIEGNNASQYGIGIVCARLTEAVLRDERAIFPVAAYQEAYGVTLALPSVVGRGGVIRVLEPPMSAEEREALQQSAERLKAATGHLGIATA
ncbi:MAG: L-lactate dehydrogenase [Actinomycetota bacterium]|nr:L-lactate dehydrogenase [Actinomycetota bacterium]